MYLVYGSFGFAQNWAFIYSEVMKLISLNIERDKHLERWLPFLHAERPDVVCLQEVQKPVFDRVCAEFGWHGLYASMMEVEQQGIAIFSRHPLREIEQTVYTAFTEDYPEKHPARSQRPMETLLVAEVLGKTIATTHFTWEPNGGVSEAQRVNLPRLMKLIDAYPSIIFCGDFNAPRGQEIFDAIAARYQDTVPEEIHSTIDPNLHRAGPLELVVDGIFASHDIAVEKARVVSGLSDHCGLVLDLPD